MKKTTKTILASFAFFAVMLIASQASAQQNPNYSGNQTTPPATQKVDSTKKTYQTYGGTNYQENNNSQKNNPNKTQQKPQPSNETKKEENTTTDTPKK